MKLVDFFDAIEKHPELRGVSITTGDEGKPGCFSVEHITSRLVTVIPADVVEGNDWELLSQVMIGKREPQVLYHMTRVVGYFSRVENWNKSKIGELRDRHAGDYGVEAVSA